MWKTAFDTSYVGLTTDGAEWIVTQTKIRFIGQPSTPLHNFLVVSAPWTFLGCLFCAIQSIVTKVISMMKLWCLFISISLHCFCLMIGDVVGIFGLWCKIMNWLNYNLYQSCPSPPTPFEKGLCFYYSQPLPYHMSLIMTLAWWPYVIDLEHNVFF
jgi:hypothetical protein